MKKYFPNVLLLPIFLLAVFISPIRAEARMIVISTVTPNTTIPVGTGVSFNVTSEDYVRLTYTINDSLAGSTISNSLINTSGTFSWTPQETDIGTHNLTITTTDPYGSKSTLYQTLTVTQASPVNIVSVSPGPAVFPNNSVSFGVSAPGYVNPTFSISDSFGGSSISFRNIDSFGNVSWTPKDSDVGVHNLAIRVYGSNGRQDTVYQTIIVNGALVKEYSRGETAIAYVGTLFTFSTNLYGFSYPTYSVGDDARYNTSDTMGINGNTFTWTPEVQDIGRHTFTITASDGINVSKTQLLVNVLPKVTSITPPVNTITSVDTTNSVKTTPNTSSNKYIFKGALSFGSKGTVVSELQKRLKAEGFFSGPINGVFGPLTKASVIKYQGAHGISKLGIVGPATRASLNK